MLIEEGHTLTDTEQLLLAALSNTGVTLVYFPYSHDQKFVLKGGRGHIYDLPVQLAGAEFEFLRDEGFIEPLNLPQSENGQPKEVYDITEAGARIAGTFELASSVADTRSI